MSIPADFHTHILPYMDDGSKSTDMSIRMLREEARQGLKKVALTPHFYAYENSPSEFLRRREQCWKRLEPCLDDSLPELLLGAEVQYFEGIARVPEILQLCLGDTGYLLLEMPFRRWSERMIHEMLNLNSRENLTVVLAHVDRYFAFQPSDIWASLSEEKVKMQLNADAFLRWKTCFKAKHLLREGVVQFVGSDCHNLDSRAPNLGQAEKKIVPCKDFLITI